MQTALLVPIVVVVLIAAGIILLVRSARSLRRTDNELDRDWLNIEKLFKQRNDELPRLLQTCRSYNVFLEELQRVADARSAAQRASSLEEKAQAHAKITGALGRLFSQAQKHPGLKGNQSFLQLENSLTEIEERIAERSETFNEDANRFNARLARFPGSISGRRLKPRALFQPPGDANPSRARN